MRWQDKPEPANKEIRYKTFFAWWPITLGYETRWLEKVTVKQKYRKKEYGPLFVVPAKWITASFDKP